MLVGACFHLGEGLCGTCLVKVVEGMEVLSPRDRLEELILKGRVSWDMTTARFGSIPDHSTI